MLWLDEKIIVRCSTVVESESLSMYEASLNHNIYKQNKASVIWNGSACGVAIDKYDLSKKAEWREEVRAQFGIPQNAMVFGYCGRITRDKGMNELFAAFHEVINHRDAYLMLIGAYDNVSTIDKDLFQWAKDCPKVIFSGRTDNVPKYYSALDVFMSLSYREGFGLVVIEAAAMGVPGIVSDALGQRDTIENNVTGLSVATKNVEQVVNAMIYCVDNPNIVSEMGKTARMVVEEKYDQLRLFEQLAEHRNRLIAES